jgi:glutathionylspermidine synthase
MNQTGSRNPMNYKEIIFAAEKDLNEKIPYQIQRDVVKTVARAARNIIETDLQGEGKNFQEALDLTIRAFVTSLAWEWLTQNREQLSSTLTPMLQKNAPKLLEPLVKEFWEYYDVRD